MFWEEKLHYCSAKAMSWKDALHFMFHTLRMYKAMKTTRRDDSVSFFIHSSLSFSRDDKVNCTESHIYVLNWKTFISVNSRLFSLEFRLKNSINKFCDTYSMLCFWWIGSLSSCFRIDMLPSLVLLCLCMIDDWNKFKHDKYSPFF